MVKYLNCIFICSLISAGLFSLETKPTDPCFHSFQSNGNPGIRFCNGNVVAVPTFYSSTSTAVIVFKSEAFNINSRVGFTYQIAGELGDLIFYSEKLPLLQLRLELTPVSRIKVC